MHQLDEVARTQVASGNAYLQFLSEGTLSVGHYALAAGSEDSQAPHAEDEVYYVVSGQAMIRVGDEARPVQAGTVIFVGARVPHRFFDIREDLSLLVFFAPEHRLERAE